MTLSFNKSISFPSPPKSFEVKFHGPPAIEAETLNHQKATSYEEGKKAATTFYLEETDKLKNDYAERQNLLLETINKKVDQTVVQLEQRLPELVMTITERILPTIELNADAIKSLVISMIKEFSKEDEKLDIFLCKNDLDLLKALSRKGDSDENLQSEEGGFASAIAGIFEGLDGDESLLDGYPNVKFFEDESLAKGDCQIKSRFGLLDGRIATKLRKVSEELKGND